MRILLDTHVFLWYITNDRRLQKPMAEAIQASDNEIYLSVVSVWEALVKFQLGRLTLPDHPYEYLVARQEQHRIASLPLERGATSRLLLLPTHHNDPFDRMLICQAVYHDLTLATSDAHVQRYPVKLLPTA